jgi:uncharacterized protein
MADQEESKVYNFDNSDPAMQKAYENARASFRYFWRELAWERRRIIPGLGMAALKAPFSDGKRSKQRENPEVEHMWMNDIDFDGEYISGTLINSPNWLKSVKIGDSAQFKLNEISDWMYSISDIVYGAFTVNLIRSRMSARERKEHDNAWGLNFGDPKHVRLVPEQKKSGGLLKGLFSKRSANEDDEHPMSEAMVASLQEHLQKDPSMAESPDDHGWTLLHHQALAGSEGTVKVLLQYGANPKAKTDKGFTPLHLAKTLGWERVIALLSKKA